MHAGFAFGRSADSGAPPPYCRLPRRSLRRRDSAARDACTLRGSPRRRARPCACPSRQPPPLLQVNRPCRERSLKRIDTSLLGRGLSRESTHLPAAPPAAPSFGPVQAGLIARGAGCACCGAAFPAAMHPRRTARALPSCIAASICLSRAALQRRGAQESVCARLTAPAPQSESSHASPIRRPAMGASGAGAGGSSVRAGANGGVLRAPSGEFASPPAPPGEAFGSPRGAGAGEASEASSPRRCPLCPCCWCCGLRHAVLVAVVSERILSRRHQLVCCDCCRGTHISPLNVCALAQGLAGVVQCRAVLRRPPAQAALLLRQPLRPGSGFKAGRAQ